MLELFHARNRPRHPILFSKLFHPLAQNIFRGTEKVQGQIYENVFATNGGYCTCEDEQTLAELNSAHRRLQAKCHVIDR